METRCQENSFSKKQGKQINTYDFIISRPEVSDNKL